MRTNRKYLLTFLLCSVFVVVFLHTSRFFDEISETQKYKMLSDATVIPAAVLLSISAFVYISSTGVLDIFGYGTSKLSLALTPKVTKKNKTYYEYKQEKTKTRNKKFGFIFHIGLIFMVLSVIFSILYYF